MRKIYGIALAVMLSLSLAACGKETNNDTAEPEEIGIDTLEEKVAETAQTAEEKVSEAVESDSSEVPDDASKAKASAEEASKDTASEQKSDDSAKEDSKEAEKETASGEEAKESQLVKEEAAGAENADAGNTSSVEKQPISEENVNESQAAAVTPPKDGYGRILFVGDSRTVDMFSAEVDRIAGDVYDGITVYAHDGDQYDEMVADVNNAGIDSFDTLVSWMGCNDFGKFGEYGSYYEQLMSQGKNVVVCTVGPTVDECLLDDMDWFYYPNENQIKYNNSLVAWANSKGVRVIDLYSFISNSTTITVVPTDGIHYLPQPTTELWSEIKKYIK